MSDARKAPLDLVPLVALCGAARVLAHGNTKKKPGTDEPRAPGDFIERKLDGVFYASTLRHVMDMQPLNGVVTAETLAKLDRDSGLPVIDHAICNLIIIRAMLIRDGKLPADPCVPLRVPFAWRPDHEADPLLDGDESPETKAAMADFFRKAATYEAGPKVEPCTTESPCKACRESRAEREARERLIETKPYEIG